MEAVIILFNSTIPTTAEDSQSTAGVQTRYLLIEVRNAFCTKQKTIY